MKKSFDTIVLGLGAMGSAACYQLAKKGVNVLGIDQFSPPHKYGSSFGDTRITRQAAGEGEIYVPLALRSYEIWDELEKQTEKKLLYKTGGLVIGDYTPNKSTISTGFLGTTVQLAQKYKIKHKILTTEKLIKEFPQFNLSGNEYGYYEENAGYLLPELCIATQLALAEKYGATLQKNERVLKVTKIKDRLEVKTEKQTYLCQKLIITAGPWVFEQLPKRYRSLFKIYRQVQYWFDVQKNYQQFTQNNLPVFVWKFTDGTKRGIYGFPARDGKKGGIKIAGGQRTEIENPNSIQRHVTTDETSEMYEMNIKNYINGVLPNCIKSISCLFTNTPDSNFIIDFLPENTNILVASPCSGHGFKHSAAVGEMIAQLVVDKKTSLDSRSFSLSRFSL